MSRHGPIETLRSLMLVSGAGEVGGSLAGRRGLSVLEASEHSMVGREALGDWMGRLVRSRHAGRNHLVGLNDGTDGGLKGRLGLIGDVRRSRRLSHTALGNY